MSSSYYIGIDVGGTNVRIGIVDDQNNIILDEKYKSSEIAPKFESVIEDFVMRHQSNYTFKAISIGYPGLAQQETLDVYYIPNQRAFEGTYLNNLQKKLGIPIVVGNDTNFLMLYDALYFGIPQDKSVLGFYLGTGFGNAIRIKNQLYQGDTGAAGEIGHVPVYVQGVLPKQGKQPDLESVVSGFNLIEIHKKHFSDSPFETMLIDHFESEVIQTYLHLLAYYIATEMIMLDITTIILGGGVIMSDQFPRSYLEELIKKNLLTDLQKKMFKAYFANPSANSGVVGAAIYARSMLK